MTYDPRAHGARCDLCLLSGKGCTPVPPEHHPSAQLVFVGEAPGRDEEERGAPFVGSSGTELSLHMALLGLSRKDASYTNALLCRPPDNEFKRLMREWRVGNEQRIAQSLTPLPSPAECCAPRLREDLEPYPNIITLGATALSTLLGEMPGREKIRRSRRDLDDGTGADQDEQADKFSRGVMESRGQLYPIDELDKEGRIVRQRKILPALHPAFVLHAKRWRSVFRADLARALRWFRNQLGWVEPKTVYRPSPTELRQFLRGPWPGGRPKFHVVDVETAPGRVDEDGSPLWDPLLDILRCVGFGTEDAAMCVPFLSIDGTSTFYTQEETRELIDIIAEWAEDVSIMKVAHNNYYDTQVIGATWQRWTGWWLTVKPIFDTLLAHRVVEPDHPHNLGFVGTFYTDIDAWKQGKIATTTRSDVALGAYNMKDDVVTARVVVPLASQVEQAGVGRALDSDHKMSEICAGMHRVGMWIDQSVRAEFDTGLALEERRWELMIFDILKARTPAIDPMLWRACSRCHAGSGALCKPTCAQRMRIAKAVAAGEEVEDDRRLNLHSREQISDLLFGAGGLSLPLAQAVQPQDLFTSSGERSTGDPVLRSYVGDARLPRSDRDLCHALRMVRRARKLRGTYVTKLRPDVDSAGRPPAGVVLYPDGRVHADWNAGRTGPGRLATSRPNVQNVPANEHPTRCWCLNCRQFMDLTPEAKPPKSCPHCGCLSAPGKGPAPLVLKDMFQARPGHVLVGADQDALHLRIIASRWGVQRLAEAFLQPRTFRGIKMGPHEMFAETLFGESFLSAPGWPDPAAGTDWKGAAKNQRGVGKTVRYAGAYKAGVPTIYREVTSVEDKRTGKLPFAHMTESEVEDLYNTWMQKEPEWARGWEAELTTWRSFGYIQEPILGRKAWCRDEKENDIINIPILMIEAAVMHLVTQDFVAAVPFEYAGPGTGLINQCHDSLTAEVPEWDAQRVAGIMTECMTRTIPGFLVPFKGKAKIGRTWQEV